MKIFGNTIAWAFAVADARRAPAVAGSAVQQRAALAKEYTKMIMTVIVSLFVLCVFGLGLFRAHDESMRKVCAGFVGTVIGYWLK